MAAENRMYRCAMWNISHSVKGQWTENENVWTVLKKEKLFGQHLCSSVMLYCSHAQYSQTQMPELNYKVTYVIQFINVCTIH